jgi:hypothetical protein
LKKKETLLCSCKAKEKKKKKILTHKSYHQIDLYYFYMILQRKSFLIFLLSNFKASVDEKKRKLIGQSFYARDTSKNNRLVDEGNYRSMMSRRRRITIVIDANVSIKEKKKKKKDKSNQNSTALNR